jgi:hypothetical protein
VRPDGAPFADSMPNIINGWILHPPLIDENGREVRSADQDPVATGTNGDGTADGTCGDWRAPASVHTHAGSPTATHWGWSNGFAAGHEVSCGVPMHLYCFGIDHVTTVSVAPQPGKKAFLSDGDFTGTSVEAADLLCNAEANRARLAGTFAAAIATSKVPVVSRFAATRPYAWVRLDGVPLNDPGESLFWDPLRAPLNLTSRLEYVGAPVHTGAPDAHSPAADPLQACDDWAITDFSGSTPWSGYSGRVDSWFGTAGPMSCDRRGVRVYCLEK